MIDTTEPKIIIICESIVESAMLMILLSPLTKNLTACSDYIQGLIAIQEAEKSKAPFDLTFVALPPDNHRELDIAVKVLAHALQHGDPTQTIILCGEKLPQQFNSHDCDDSNVLCKPITREKLEKVLSPLRLTLPKLNCWEYMECGRQPGGTNAKELGICPAAEEQAAEGIHCGKYGGRACWAVSGTLCGGGVQGSFASKMSNCTDCDFYKVVQYEEGDCFESINSILNRLKRNGGQG